MPSGAAHQGRSGAGWPAPPSPPFAGSPAAHPSVPARHRDPRFACRAPAMECTGTRRPRWRSKRCAPKAASSGVRGKCSVAPIRMPQARAMAAWTFSMAQTSGCSSRAWNFTSQGWPAAPSRVLTNCDAGPVGPAATAPGRAPKRRQSVQTGGLMLFDGAYRYPCACGEFSLGHQLGQALRTQALTEFVNVLGSGSKADVKHRERENV